MKWIIGRLVFKISNLLTRFVNQYIIYCFAEHGENCHIDGKCCVSAKNIHIGNNVFIAGGATFVSTDAQIYIGNDVMFGPNVSIVTGNHRTDVIGKHMIDVHEKREKDDEDVVIEDDVWIGMGATILKEVTIGKGSVIGANTLVVNSVPPYSIVTTKIQTMVKQRFSEEELILHKKVLEER